MGEFLSDRLFRIALQLLCAAGAAPFLWNLANAPEPGVMVGASSPPAIIAAALIIFFLIYAVYILLAYTSLRRNVLPQ